MEGDPTGGMWIYLIFLIIPLARILPRMLKKYRRKKAGLEPESEEKFRMNKFFTSEREPEPEEKFRMNKFFTSEREPEPEEHSQEPQQEPKPKPEKKDGWVGKDDFK